MKKQNTLLLLLIILSFATCKKKHQNQYSTWYVNSDSFSTNDVVYYSDRGGNSLASSSQVNGFAIFNQGDGVTIPPQVGTGFLSPDYSTHNPGSIHAILYYNAKTYYQINISSTADTLVITQVNGKYCYEIYPAWFVNGNNSSDSILIQGTFNQP